MEQSKLPVKLTTRQRSFLSRLMDIYSEIQKPVHYSIIAKHLGLSSSTAYDMLKVLEGKGMVSSEYRTPKAVAGPGRSNIMFVPSTRTVEQFGPEEDVRGSGEWGEAKANIMVSLGNGVKRDNGKLVHSLFEQADNSKSPLARCAQILTALLLSLKDSKPKSADQNLIGTFLKKPVTNLDMSSIAGFILGLSLTDKKVHKYLENYQEFINKYIQSLQNMSHENLVMLQEFTLDVWRTLQGSPAY